MKNGPVGSATKDIVKGSSFLASNYKEYANGFLKASDKWEYQVLLALDTKMLSDSEIEILSLVYEYYGKYNQFTLRDISHRFPEWAKWEDQLKADPDSRFPMTFDDFFKDCNEPPPLFEDKDESLELVKSLFEQKDKVS